MNGYKAARLELGLTIEQAIKLIGISKSFLVKIERNEKKPSIITLLKMGKAYKCSIGDFFSEKTTRNV